MSFHPIIQFISFSLLSLLLFLFFVWDVMKIGIIMQFIKRSESFVTYINVIDYSSTLLLETAFFLSPVQTLGCDFVNFVDGPERSVCVCV